MTTKQIAEAVNKDVKTVQRWVKKVGDTMSSVSDKMALSSPNKPADYDIEETCSIIQHGLGKNAADLYRMNAREVPALQSSLTDRDIELIQKLTAGIVTQVMANLNQRVEAIETRIEKRQALLPAPQMDAKQQVNKIIRDHCSATGKAYRDAWVELYREFGYRTHTNPSLSAKNRGMTIIDYIESEGQIETLIAVASDVMIGNPEDC